MKLGWNLDGKISYKGILRATNEYGLVLDNIRELLFSSV